MSAGIAAAMVRAACKHQSVSTQVDAEDAMKQFAAFSPQLLHTPEGFGGDVVDSGAPVHSFVMQWSPPNLHGVQSCLGSEFH